MVKHNLRLILLCLLVLFTFFIPGPVGPDGVRPGSLWAGEIDLTILHLNDTHGFILPHIEKSVDKKIPVGGAAWLAKMIEKERALNPQGTLLLSAGDMFQGTPISNIFEGRPVLEIMNQLRFDAMAVGNHEFDWGQPVLVKMSSAARFPFLTSNIAGANGKKLPWLSHILLKRKGLTIAVIGVTTPNTPFTTKPGNVEGLHFSRPEKNLPGLIAGLRRAGADLVIVLSHLGLEGDQALAEKVPDIDVIVGGHSHTAVQKPVLVGNTIIVQAKCYAEYLGVLKLKVDSESKKIISYEKRDVLQKTLSGPDDSFDPAIAEIVARYNDQIKEEFGKIVGETRSDLIRNAGGESNLGNLVCDAMRESSGSGIAFQNSGGIRANISRGKITLEQVFTVLPFDNDLISMDLTGAQIRAILEQNVSQEHGILQLSGLKVKYDRNQPRGSRVAEAMADGKALMPEGTYRVTVNDFLASGGDQFNVFKQGKNIAYGDSVRDAVVSYLKRRSPVEPQIERRIIFVP